MRCALAVGLMLCTQAWGMEPLSDNALSAVRGRDGVSFDLHGFAMTGDARVSYTTPLGTSLYVEKFHAARSDNPLPFSDPYRLDILPSAPGLADYINIAFPTNANGDQRWQLAYDWGVGANGVVREQAVWWSRTWCFMAAACSSPRRKSMTASLLGRR